MEVTAWMSLYHAMNAEQDRRPFSRETFRRIGVFARPHRAQLVKFLLLSVLTVLVPFIGYPRTLNGLAALNDITGS